MRYRKKPVVIEAERFCVSDGPAAALKLAAWCGGLVPSMRAIHPVIEIPTLEGVMTAVDGDWIIRGIAGEFYPCKPDIFAATYEAVEEQPAERGEDGE